MKQADFDWLATEVCTPGDNDHQITLSLSAEQSEFIRINRSRVRQATTVSQQMATVSVIQGRRRVASRISLPSDLQAGRALLMAARQSLIDAMRFVPDDPNLLLPDSVRSSERVEPADGLPDSGDAINTLLEAGGDTDLVGFYASGPMTRAFANSDGQRNWHQVASFHFDWSLFAATSDAKDRAVKSAVAGRIFDPDALNRQMHSAREQLAWLQQPVRRIEPGRYRAWLAPAAVAELLQAMAWSGFSRKERASGTSSLIRVAEGRASLSRLVTLTEDTANGIAPAFTETGHLRPPEVSLVSEGELGQSLTSPRSAAEFDEPVNAGGSEYPEALVLAPGTLPDSGVLQALGTGLWISNLWYLNYSDRQAARVTGMTRFACFWVENGRIVAPVNVMRFDDSLLDLFGPALEAVGEQVQFLPGSSTWGSRELNSVSCPGLLLSGLKLTL